MTTRHMPLSRRIAAAVLVSVLACDQPTSPGRGAGLFLDVEGSATAALDSGKVIVRGPTNKTVKVMPGATVAIEGLIPGTYTIALQGFDSGGIARFFQTTGVTVVAHQNSTVTASAAQFAPFVPAMNPLPPSGMGTTFTVRYDSVAGAASYEVEAATDQMFTVNRVAVSASQTSTQVTVGNPGTYYVRVRAIDMFEGRGRASPFQVIQVTGAPAIRLSETTVNFGAPQGGGNPAALTVAVTNGGGGTLSGLSAGVSYTTGSGWLNASLSTTTAPSTLTLQPLIGSLVAGTYTATVSVASAVAGNSPQTVTVTLTVGTQLPAIVLSSGNRSFSATQGGANPAAQTVGVTNGGGGTLSGLSATVSYTTGSGWLSATLSTTTAPSTLTIRPTTGSLAAGTYTATVSVASAVASNSPQTVSVTFTVAAQPTIVVAPASLSFTAPQGGASPAAQTVAVTNGTEGTLSGLSATVSYTTGSGWLNATLNTTTAPSTLTVQPATGSLAAGTYTATVSVASAVASNSPRTVGVTFTIAPPPPSIVVTPASRSFSATQGGANPAAQTVAVTNGGGGTLSGLSVSVSYSGSGGGWLNATLNTTTAPSTLTLQPTTGSLVAGTYNATVSVESGVASNSPRTVSVTFTVAVPPPSIVLTPTSRSFTATTGGPNPATQTVAVTNGGGGTLSGLNESVTYTAGQPNNWLDREINPKTAPSTLTLTAKTGSLPPGTYTATVAVTSGVASNSPQTVTVTFTVAPRIVLSRTSVTFNASLTGANPPAQTVSVTNVGAVSGLSATVSYTSGSGWLGASLSSTTAPSTLTLTATKPLLVGTYRATVSVASAVAGNSPQNVSVTFNVSQ